MCFQGIDFHKLRLVPIISVGVVMIRLWIISLDHYFPLLCWLGAIHLPPPLESQMLLNCLSCSLLFFLFYPPLSQPQSPLMIVICRAVFIRDPAGPQPMPAPCVQGPSRKVETPLLILPSSCIASLSQQTVTHQSCYFWPKPQNDSDAVPPQHFHKAKAWP